jgi:PAS domain S-box-containing protein
MSGDTWLERVVGLMPGMVYAFNHLSRCVEYTNQSACAFLGYDEAEIRRFGERMLLQVVHPDDLAQLEGHLARIAALGDGQSTGLECSVLTKQGARRWLRCVDTVFDRAPDGGVLRHIGWASDITTEKEALLTAARLTAELEAAVAARTKDLTFRNAELEERINARTFELQDAVEELEQLTYIATHDLKVPVNNLGRLGLMLAETADTLTPDQAEQVGWINQCAHQLSAKIQGLVLVSQIRLSSGQPSHPLDLRAAVADTVANMTPAGERRAPGNDAAGGLGGQRYGLPVILDIAENITVHFSRFELDSIVYSLLDNARKYADPSRPLRITVRAAVSDGQVTLAVADNGTGLDPARDAQKVFGLFQRAHKTPAGSGISLYCARRMVRRRGGALTVTGARGAGAEFKLVFPKEGTE